MANQKIKIGFRVGMLEVVEQTPERKNGYVVWRCRCDCGGECFLDTRRLQRGLVSDCGCKTKVPPGAVDLTGQRFGRLVALAPTKQRKFGGQIVWECICDCGTQVNVPSGQLVSGYSKSCGCLGHPPVKDYVGKRFGMLTVIAYEGKENKQHIWRCRCDCGKEALIGQTNLQSGKTKSCGCLQASIICKNMKFVDGTSIVMLENAKTKKISNNTSGYNGVYKNKRTGRWVAQITFKRKTYYLGSYDSIDEAVDARRKGEVMYDDFLEWYYKNHEKADEVKKSIAAKSKE